MVVVIFAILSPADLDGMVLPPLPSPVMDTIKQSLTTEPLPPTAPSSTTTEAIINATTTGLTALPGITLPTLALPLKLYPYPHHRWSTGFFFNFFKKSIQCSIFGRSYGITYGTRFTDILLLVSLITPYLLSFYSASSSCRAGPVPCCCWRYCT